jgi:uncharacterized protein (TIGR02452 family)
MTESSSQITRVQAAKMGREAVEIIEAGYYRLEDGSHIDIGEAVTRSVQGTQAYPPEAAYQQQQPGSHKTKIEVHNETTLSAARRLLDSGQRPVALNFASATYPGGGFLHGARAQEEYLARSSGLYACLRDQSMYDFHRRRNDPLYTSYMLYSPDVPIFRSDEGSVLSEPYPVSIITAAAPNANLLDPDKRPAIEQAFRERIAKLLWIGLQHDHDAIVLGAWGCGAFGNDGHMVSRLFRDALQRDFPGAYRQVTFAIVDWSGNRQYIGPFEAAFKK